MMPGVCDEVAKQKEEISKTHRVICFSNIGDEADPNSEILMWAHYTNNHNGFRICFETDLFSLKRKSLFEIRYSEERPTLDVNKTEDADKIYEEVIETKFKTWKYENEYRLLINIQECFSKKIGKKSLEFIKINPSVILSIDIGLKVPDRHKKDLLNLLKKEELKHIKVTTASLHKTKYMLNYIAVNGRI